MLDNGDLMIRDVNWANNMGLFRCVAENIAGSDRVDAFLYPVRHSTFTVVPCTALYFNEAEYHAVRRGDVMVIGRRIA